MITDAQDIQNSTLARKSDWPARFRDLFIDSQISITELAPTLDWWSCFPSLNDLDFLEAYEKFGHNLVLSI